MDHAAVREARQRIARWIEDGQSVLGVLPGFFDDHEQMREGLEAADRECARLREELAAARNESLALRTEREELAEALSDGLNRVMNEALQRLRTPVKASAEMRPQPTYS